jgi:hypothetical protein
VGISPPPGARFFGARLEQPGQNDAMADASAGLSSEIRARLAALSGATPAHVHRLQVGLAWLVLSQAPPAASGQLDLAVAFIEGRATSAELRDAKQDCWTYVGSLACGCTISDSASAHAVMSCLETDEAAHASAALAEQAHQVLRCGASETAILHVLESLPEQRGR